MRTSIAVIFAAACVVSCGAPDGKAAFQLPEPGRTLVVERQPIHAYLAEYSRSIGLYVDGQAIARAPMFDDTGGYSRTNLYRLAESTFLLRDAEASYTVDVATSSITRHDDRRLGGTFVGSFDEDASANWRFIASTERGELPTEFPGR